jgi:hypothetical protein
MGGARWMAGLDRLGDRHGEVVADVIAGALGTGDAVVPVEVDLVVAPGVAHQEGRGLLHVPAEREYRASASASLQVNNGPTESARVSASAIKFSAAIRAAARAALSLSMSLSITLSRSGIVPPGR